MRENHFIVVWQSQLRGVPISIVGELKVTSLRWNDSTILMKIIAVTLTLCLSDFMPIKSIWLAYFVFYLKLCSTQFYLMFQCYDDGTWIVTQHCLNKTGLKRRIKVFHVGKSPHHEDRLWIVTQDWLNKKNSPPPPPPTNSMRAKITSSYPESQRRGVW